MIVPEALLEVNGLTKRFGGLTAVDDVSLTLCAGEIVSLIGPNGSGKTTFFHCVTGFYRPDAGSVKLRTGEAAHELIGRPAHAIRALGIARTFQTREIFGEMSLMDCMLLGRHTRTKTGLLGAVFNPRRSGREDDLAREQAAKIFAIFPGRFGPERWSESAESLSFANRCRLEIAMGLMSDPSLLMLDEPAAGMNPNERAELMDTLRGIRDLGYTLLVVEHNMRVVLGISDRLIVLDRGRKIADGEPEEVFRDPLVTTAYLGDDYDVT